MMFSKKDFHLTDEEHDAINKWAETHNCPSRNRSCCGGEISVTFTPTSIDTFVSAKCVCGAKLELEELDDI